MTYRFKKGVISEQSVKTWTNRQLHVSVNNTAHTDPLERPPLFLHRCSQNNGSSVRNTLRSKSSFAKAREENELDCEQVRKNKEEGARRKMNHFLATFSSSPLPNPSPLLPIFCSPQVPRLLAGFLNLSTGKWKGNVC